MEEVSAVAHAHGIKLDDTVVTNTMKYTLIRWLANATTSLQRDICGGKAKRDRLLERCGGSARTDGKGLDPGKPVYLSRLLPQESRARGNGCFRNEPRELTVAHGCSDLQNGQWGAEMMTSAELRWFWRGRCPQPVYDWFFESGLPPGGGQSRVDRYIPQRGEPDISLKRRGDKT